MTEDSFDFVGIEVTLETISRDLLKGIALVFDAEGRPVRVPVHYRLGENIFEVVPTPMTGAAVIEWLYSFGQLDVLEDCRELLQIHRDWLRDLDIQSGPMLDFRPLSRAS